MINSEIAYFDPNTYGDRGYSLIGPLLLFYKKLVIYGPSGYFIEKSCENKDIRNTSLTPAEFIRYIEEDIIVPLGFKTFFNRDERDRLYLPELRITTDFDRGLISSPSLSQKAFSVPNDYKHDHSPKIAKDLINRHPDIKDRLLAEIHNDNLPQRYKDLKKDVNFIPDHLKNIANTTEPNALLPFVMVYDLLNNKHVMASEGSAGVHSQYFEFRGIYRAIHGLEDVRKKQESQQVEIIADVLKTCISEITYGRLDSEQINEFRVRHRDNFVSFIESAFMQFENTTDFFKKKENIIEVVSDKLRNIKIHLAISPDNLISMIPLLKVMSKPISLLFDGKRGTLRNKINHFLHQPLHSSDRWAYHFLKLKK
ncbi:MAG: hypothetical protein JNK95_11940 [Candidatus Competibacter sp.]|nr:hypothetical protein [Candidatus Competibacter sp.]MDG4604987.1 hypothetical protein [Candidatus Contendobacter sp.]HRD50098.1 hypothetical protein [Candidatus Contendobacter sp.]